jgi:hypothetical protein
MHLTFCKHSLDFLLSYSEENRKHPNVLYYEIYCILFQTYTTVEAPNFFIGVVGDGDQFGPLGTAAINRPIVPAPGDYVVFLSIPVFIYVSTVYLCPKHERGCINHCFFCYRFRSRLLRLMGLVFLNM